MKSPRPPSLKREIVAWYSLVLLIALGLVTALTFVLLEQALERTVRTSLRQAAVAAEKLYVPRGIPPLATDERMYQLRSPHLEVMRRRTLLATGDTVEIWLARSDAAEQQALRWFLLISLLLIPLTGVAAALGGRALLERLLTPLDQLVGATREIEIAELSRRVEEPERPAELQELSHAFNEMLTRLEAAVAALSRFTADASHELRTPLTAIRGSVQVALARERTPAELRDTLAEVLEETEWMLHLVDGLLTLARGEEAGGPSQLEEVDVGELLKDVCEVGEALATGRPIRVELAAHGDLRVRGSPAQLRQVFLNLLSNAVKFTEQGEIRVTATSSVERREVVVRVADTGIGIPPEELPRVFDRFYRGDAARARPAGTGLGLAIARLLVHQHGGELSVASEVRRGSEFTVRLPVDGPPAGQPAGAGFLLPARSTALSSDTEPSP